MLYIITIFINFQIHSTPPPPIIIILCKPLFFIEKSLIVMEWGTAEATGLGFVCFVVSTLVCSHPTELILGFFLFHIVYHILYHIYFFSILLPPPQTYYIYANILHRNFLHFTPPPAATAIVCISNARIPRVTSTTWGALTPPRVG